VTTDVIEAACACLVATLEESASVNDTETVSERLMLEEFGRCLTRVVESASNLTGRNACSLLRHVSFMQYFK